MPISRADFVQETTTTTGTGTYSLGGVAATNRRTFVAGNGTGATVRYAVTDGSSFEVGEGIITDATPDTLTRATILASSNGGLAVSWGVGSKTVSQVMTAAELNDMRTDIDGKAASGHDHAGTYQPFATIVTETGTTRTLALTDDGKYLLCSNAAGCTITVPPQSSVTWTANAEIHGRGSVGTTTFTPGSGVTVDIPAALTLVATAKAMWTLKREAENVWALAGYLVVA